MGPYRYATIHIDGVGAFTVPKPVKEVLNSLLKELDEADAKKESLNQEIERLNNIISATNSQIK